MIAKTAEGLLGANNAMNVIRTPMKVFKEARARGDRVAMDRAMGYVEKAHDEAWEKKYSADEGLKQEAEENKLKAEQQREELTQRIREKLDELENRTDGNGIETITDTAEAEASETDPAAEALNKIAAEVATADNTAADSPAPVTYTKSGEVRSAAAEVKFSVTV